MNEHETKQQCEIESLRTKLADALYMQKCADEMACSGTNIMKAAR